MTRKKAERIAAGLALLHRALDPMRAAGEVDVMFSQAGLCATWEELVNGRTLIVASMPLGTSYSALVAPQGARLLRFRRALP